MIGEPFALQIKENIDRPSIKLINKFKNVPTTYLADALNGLGCLDYKIKPIDEKMSFCGPAVTTFCGPLDNLGAMAVLDFVERGDIIVISAGGDLKAAKIGDLWLEVAKKKGVAGVVCDGLVRDKEGLLAIGTPVFSRGISSNSGFKNGPSTLNLPVVCGGINISPGDIIAGDRDGVVRIPKTDIAKVEKNLNEVSNVEKDAISALKCGKKIKFWNRSALEKKIELIND